MKNLFKKLNKTDKQNNLVADILIVIPRILCGLFLAFGFGSSKFGMPWSSGEENLALFHVSSWFVEDVSKFGGLFAIFPLFFAWMAAATETIGALFLMFGYKTRIASFFLAITMLVAIFFQKWDNGLWAMLPAIGFLWVSIYSLVLGSGRFGLDFLIWNRKSNKNLLSTPIKEIKKKIRPTLPVLVIMILFSFISQEKRQVTFKLNTNNLQNVNSVVICGNTKPISSKDNFALTDKDKDGIYEGTIGFSSSVRNVRFKFIVNGEKELKGANSRIVWLKDTPITKSYVFNEFNYYDSEKLQKLVFTEAQLEEDVKVLREIIQYVHPNIYGFRDSVLLQKDFDTLLQEMKAKPGMTQLYGSVSKFLAKTKCSHTFTNPWNQGGFMEKANFYQPDKIPFTFNRIGKRLFLDKNASANPKLTKGLEVISLNDVPTDLIMTKLAKYITSDGSNYEKKLERLVVSGEDKFSLFDIFYSIEFGSKNEFLVELKNINTKEQFTAKVKAVSNTNRTKVLSERYQNIATSLKDSWSFEIINSEAAKLTIKSFAVQRNEFDWKHYLDNVFKELNTKSIPNLIIDIRGNEGGQEVVGKYILERVIQEPFKVNAIKASVRYKKIPQDYKKYISTWDNFPYDFKRKIDYSKGDRFYLKEKYTLKGTTLKPKKKNYKGKVYLMTDAANSSATHIMAAYAKQIKNITLVGQETGGNQLGTNGSFIFFLRLPNTKIEIDIPVINQFVLTGQVAIDKGIVPSILVEKNLQDFINNIDTELSVVLGLIGENN